MKYSDKPLEPGFYQTERQYGAVGGPRLVGRKTGRVAPRDHVMQPAWEDTLQRHDLLPMNDHQVGSNREFNYDQGQLFDTQAVTPRDTRSDVEVAKSRGAVTGEITSERPKNQNPVLGATPGFMPGLTRAQKVAAITNIEQGRIASGASRGGAPFKEMMEDREEAFQRGSRTSSAWYMGKDEGGNYNRNVQGDAATKIQESAARVGAGSEEHLRTTAIMSPQMGWKSEGGTDDPMTGVQDRGAATAGVYPNIVVAEEVARSVRGRPESKFQVHSPSELGGIPSAHEKATAHVARSAGSSSNTSRPYEIQDMKSQKAANFDASLSLSHIDPVIQRIASQSWTADRHDVATVGMDAESKEFKRQGSYEAVAMTGRRAALKHRMLPPNEQSIEWEGQRATKGLGMGNQMFVSGTGLDGEAPVVRPELRAPRHRNRKTNFRYDPANDPGGPGF